MKMKRESKETFYLLSHQARPDKSYRNFQIKKMIPNLKNIIEEVVQISLLYAMASILFKTSILLR
jgi:hypothetical protein